MWGAGGRSAGASGGEGAGAEQEEQAGAGLVGREEHAGRGDPRHEGHAGRQGAEGRRAAEEGTRRPCLSSSRRLELKKVGRLDEPPQIL